MKTWSLRFSFKGGGVMTSVVSFLFLSWMHNYLCFSSGLPQIINFWFVPMKMPPVLLIEVHEGEPWCVTGGVFSLCFVDLCMTFFLYSTYDSCLAVLFGFRFDLLADWILTPCLLYESESCPALFDLFAPVPHSCSTAPWLRLCFAPLLTV